MPFPLLGEFLSDRFLGKYRTILWLSLSTARGTPASRSSRPARPASPRGARAHRPRLGRHQALRLGARRVTSSPRRTSTSSRACFALFYWIINFGSFFASALIPKTLEWWGPRVAFGIPGALYVHPRRSCSGWGATGMSTCRRPARTRTRSSASSGTPSGSGATRGGTARGHFLDVRRAAGQPRGAIDGAKAVLRVMTIFAPIPVFWALFDQEGVDLDRPGDPHGSRGPRPQAHSVAARWRLNPLLVMLIIPLQHDDPLPPPSSGEVSASRRSAA